VLHDDFLADYIPCETGPVYFVEEVDAILEKYKKLEEAVRDYESAYLAYEDDQDISPTVKNRQDEMLDAFHAIKECEK